MRRLAQPQNHLPRAYAPLRLKADLESLESERIGKTIRQIIAIDTELSHLLSRMAEHFDYPSILNALDALDTNNS